jgi:hypothetical protein
MGERSVAVRFIQETGFTIKVGQEEAHQKWLIENEDRLAKAHPKGSKYLGTFSVVFTTDKEAGFYRSFVELDSYGAIDKLAAAAKDASSEFGKLMRDWTAFGDWDVHAPWSNHLYKAVVDATLWDPPAG